MQSCYRIKKTSNEVYPYIVFSTSYINPLDQKKAIEGDLKRLGAKGTILLDLLLSHGNTPDRFFEAYFDGNEINEETLRNVKTVKNKIKKIASDFYHTQPHFINNSVLSKAQKFLIRNKQAI